MPFHVAAGLNTARTVLIQPQRSDLAWSGVLAHLKTGCILASLGKRIIDELWVVAQLLQVQDCLRMRTSFVCRPIMSHIHQGTVRHMLTCSWAQVSAEAEQRLRMDAQQQV